MNDPAPERRRFGRYEVLFPIATGGMAEVYAARSLGEAGFQKLVALKRMRPELAQDARFVAMFLDEGRLAANIDSPNVVSTLDLGRADDDSLYLVMELVMGVSLSDLNARVQADATELPWNFAASLLAQAATGLHDAHEALSATGEPLQIVHRDCSPHNIMVDTKGRAKITDFGIAKAMQRQTTSQAGEMKGKLSYLSPEQAQGLPVDRRTDIFILGIVAWETLARRQLFVAQNPIQALHLILSAPIERLDVIDPRIPSELADAVDRALQRTPDERFPTALEFADAMLDGMQGRPPHRSEIGRFIEKHGGESLHELRQGVRRAAGSSSSMLGSDSYSIPPSTAPPALSSPPPSGPALSSPPSAHPPASSLGHQPTMLSEPPPPMSPGSQPELPVTRAGRHSSRPPGGRARVTTAQLPEIPPPAEGTATTKSYRPPRHSSRPPYSRPPQSQSTLPPQGIGSAYPPSNSQGSNTKSWLSLALLITVGLGVGGFTAYWFTRARGEVSNPGETELPTLPLASDPTPTAEPTPVESAQAPNSVPELPDALDPPDDLIAPPVDTPENAPTSAQHAPVNTQEPEPHRGAETPGTHRPIRPRIRPHPGTSPGRLNDGTQPGGDRATAFDEIPWQ